jgi:hypothetical protein
MATRFSKGGRQKNEGSVRESESPPSSADFFPRPAVLIDQKESGKQAHSKQNHRSNEQKGVKIPQETQQGW